MIDLPLQFRPSPEYPDLQVQLYDPLLLLHTASALQCFNPSAHSSTSESNFPYFNGQCHVQKFPTFDRKDLHLTLLCPLNENTFNLKKRHTKLLINHGCKLFLV